MMATSEDNSSQRGETRVFTENEIEQGNLSLSSLSELQNRSRSEDGLESGNLSFESQDCTSLGEDLDVSTHFLPAESPTKKRRSQRSSVSGEGAGEDVDNMILEVGDLPDQHIPSPTEIDEIKTALSNRDTLIKKLSSALQKVCKERVQDAELTSKLEEQMKSLREQVKLTKEKASTNRSLKQRNQKLEEENNELRAKLKDAQSTIVINTESSKEKDDRIKELEEIVKMSELNKDTEDESLAPEKSSSKEFYFQQLNAQEIKLKKELSDMEESHRKELDMIEEQRVIEMNMLDAELLTLRDEKNELMEEVEHLKSESHSNHHTQQLQQEQSKQNKLIQEFEKERKLLVGKISELESVYRAENSVRISLEQNLQQMSAYLDETEYNVLPVKIRESLERSLRLSENFQQKRDLVLPLNVTQEDGNQVSICATEFKPITELDSTQNIVDETEIIKSIKEEHLKEMSELRRYFENYCQELELRYRNEFEEHLAQLANREGSSLPTVVLPPPLSLDISQGKLDLSELESISPRSLDSSQLNSLGYQGQLSGQESDGGQISFRPSLSLEASPRKPKDKPDASPRRPQDTLHKLAVLGANLPAISPKVQRQLDLSDRYQTTFTSDEEARGADRLTNVADDDKATDLSPRASDDNKIHPSLTAEISRLSIENARLVEDLHHRDGEISVLKEKVSVLEEEVCKLENIIFQEDLTKYQQVIDNLKQEHKQELEDINNEHEAQVKDLLETHRQDNEKVKSECSRDLDNLRLEHEQQIASLKNSHELEMAEVLKRAERGGEASTPHDHMDTTLINKLESDIKDMECERQNLKSMQGLMKGLISDLAMHYSLSEKQVQFLNSTSLLDSFLEGKSSDLEDSSTVNCLQTPWKFMPGKQVVDKSQDVSRLRDQQVESTSPNQSIFSMEEISNLIHNGTFLSELENSDQVLRELQRQVRQSNSKLRTMEPGSLLSKLSGLLTPPEQVEQPATNTASDQDCSKLELEKMKLQLELAAAKQRLQELELDTSRSSFSKDEIMSGIGGEDTVDHGDSRLSDEESFREVREKAAKLLTEVEGRTDTANITEIVDLLGQLLLHSDQMSTKSKVQVEDLTQQLDVADKQLRSTRLFLEEQAAEREQEREEWENKLTLAKSSQSAAKLRYPEDYTQNQEDSGNTSETQEEKQGDTKADYDALVDKVFQLREIIRTLENDIEEKSKTVERKCSEVDELRTALMESLMKQESVQKELDVLKNSSTDKEMIDLIEGLKEQLKTKSQELMGHRAAQQHLSDVKAHIRGLQERVEQSTRELESSVLGGDSTMTTSSPSSSRSSSPLNVMMKSGVSFEDVGAVEIEEVARLEKKLVHQERVEASAVKKIQDLENEINRLKSEQQDIENDKTRYEDITQELETLKSKMKKLEEEHEEEKQMNAKLETELMALKGLNMEDLQAENSVLQDRVVSLQFQVSTLQAEKQASKHRKPSQSSEMEIIIKERAELDELLEKTKDTVRILELERDTLQERCNKMMERMKELECDLDSVYTNKTGSPGGPGDARPTSLDRMVRDKAELEEINSKLIKELSEARASVLAAQKIKISKIADDLIREKNAEIDTLKQQLNEMSKGVSLSMENSSPGAWKSSMSPRSVEQLRDAPIRSLPRIPELSLSRNDYLSNKMPSPLTEHFEEDIENSLNLRSPRRSPRVLSGGTLSHHSIKSLTSSTNSKASRVLLTGTQSESCRISQPILEFTQEEQVDTPDYSNDNDNSQQMLKEKLSEIENLHKLEEKRVAELKDLKEKLAQTEIQVQDYIKDKSAQNEKISVLEKELGELKERYATAKNNSTNLQNILVNKEELLKQNEATIQQQNQELSQKGSAVAKLNTQLAAKQERIESLETKSLDGAEPNLAEEVRQLREELEDRIRGMENLHSVMEMTETELELAKKSEAEWKEKFEQLQQNQQSLVESNNSKIQELNGAIEKLNKSAETAKEEKEKTECELARVTREMAAVDAVVKEMTSQFKAESQTRMKEVQELQDTLRRSKESELKIQNKYEELDLKHTQLLEYCDDIESQLKAKNVEPEELNHNQLGLTRGGVDESFDKLSRSLNRELELTSELDQSLLNQLISANTSLNSTDEPTGIQRLLHKIQVDGVRVLTLSERLFLSNQVHDQNMKKSLQNRSLQETNRKLELMKFDIEHEKAINKDLQSALESEKQNSLDLLSKLSQERKLRNNLEDELSALQRQVRSLDTRLRNANYAVDSDNAEYMITIEAQKEQIESLEESLKMERDNFNQLQNVLSVERKRSSQRDMAQERRDEDDISELRSQLRTERQYREQLESNLGTGKSGEVAKLIISRLHAELDTEHRKVRDLTARLNQEKKKYTSLYHDLKYQNTESQQSSEVGSVDNYDDSWTRVWRTRELELERLVAELELKVEMLETSNSQNSETIANLQIQLQEERERDNSGISGDQLERMKQVNAFLEHNLKENSEMLATISRLQEERHDLRSKLHQAKLTSPSPLENVRQGEYYGKFLRSESFRKALIWQKRYLLVQISGGYFVSEPVLRVNRPRLTGSSRFKATVHVIVSIHRMKYLVKRWRTGKRSASVKPGRDRTLSLQHNSLESRSMSSMSKKRPDTLSVVSLETQSLISSPILHQPRSHGLRRASSLRERPIARSVDSPIGSVSSTSSALYRPPVVTGRTPPTRDLDTRTRPVFPHQRQRSGSTPRRSLDGWFHSENIGEQIEPVLVSGLDSDLAADLREYQQQYTKLQNQLGIKF